MLKVLPLVGVLRFRVHASLAQLVDSRISLCVIAPQVLVLVSCLLHSFVRGIDVLKVGGAFSVAELGRMAWLPRG